MMRRTLITIGIAALLVAGCGEGPPDPAESDFSIAGNDVAQSDAGVLYTQTLDRAFTAMEAPDAPPVEQAINEGNTQAIQGINSRWNASLKILESATPPADAQQSHADLVTAMRKLASWNEKILAASMKGKAQSKKTGQQARDSTASQQYGEALQQLDLLGYLPGSDDGESFTDEMDVAPPGGEGDF